MGNANVRISPLRSRQILDSNTRARYKNQHELVRLQVKLRKIEFQHNQVIYRWTSDRHEFRATARELKHASDQLEYQNSFNKRTRLDSTSSKNQSEVSVESSKSDFTDDSHESMSDSASLLMYNLNAHGLPRQSSYPSDQQNLTRDTRKSKTLCSFEEFRSQHSSEVNLSTCSSNNKKRTSSNDKRSLHDDTELMKKTIRIAMTRASRNSHVDNRRPFTVLE